MSSLVFSSCSCSVMPSWAKRLPPASARLTTMLSSGRKVGGARGSSSTAEVSSSAPSSPSAVLALSSRKAPAAPMIANTTRPIRMNSSLRLFFGLTGTGASAVAAAADMGILQKIAPGRGRTTPGKARCSEELLSATPCGAPRKRAGKSPYSGLIGSDEKVQRLAAVGARTRCCGRRGGAVHTAGRATGARRAHTGFGRPLAGPTGRLALAAAHRHPAELDAAELQQLGQRVACVLRQAGAGLGAVGAEVHLHLLAGHRELDVDRVFAAFAHAQAGVAQVLRAPVADHLGLGVGLAVQRGFLGRLGPGFGRWHLGPAARPPPGRAGGRAAPPPGAGSVLRAATARRAEHEGAGGGARGRERRGFG